MKNDGLLTRVREAVANDFCGQLIDRVIELKERFGADIARDVLQAQMRILETLTEKPEQEDAQCI